MIKREQYLQKIRPLIGDPLIKVITGMRRVGKSTLLLQIQDELKERGVDPVQFIHINFELLQYDDLRAYKKLYQHVSSRIHNHEKYYIFLDEIQEVEEFEKAVNSLNLEYNVDIYLTGSNSRLLSGELASILTGRYFSLEVFPLSLAEIISSRPDSNPNDELVRYLRFGGLPAIQRFIDQEDTVKGYISDMYSSILLKDIVSRYAIRDVDLLERFVKYVLQNVGQIFSANSIVKFLKSEGRIFSRETIYHYLDACKNAFLIYGAPRYDIRGKQTLKTSEKYFVNDLGIRGLFFDNESDIAQVLENIIYLELLRRDYQVSTGLVGSAEVDFIASQGSSKCYIQVTYLLAGPETVDREFAALEAIDDNYPKIVISMDLINRGRNGIRHMNVLDFLLNPEFP